MHHHIWSIVCVSRGEVSCPGWSRPSHPVPVLSLCAARPSPVDTVSERRSLQPLLLLFPLYLTNSVLYLFVYYLSPGNKKVSQRERCLMNLFSRLCPQSSGSAWHREPPGLLGKETHLGTMPSSEPGLGTRKGLLRQKGLGFCGQAEPAPG